MIDTIMFRLKLPNILLLIMYKMAHMNTKMRISTIGKNIDMNALNISTDGVKNFISLSSTNQSNDKNASDEAPTISTEPKISTKLSGNFKLNEYAAAIS